MEHSFYDFWRLFAPQPEYRNRYRACEKLWNDMDELRRKRIIYHLQSVQKRQVPAGPHTANPYFYLIRADPQPQWLTPLQVANALAKRIPLAVALDNTTHTYKTCTQEEARIFNLYVHHYM